MSIFAHKNAEIWGLLGDTNKLLKRCINNFLKFFIRYSFGWHKSNKSFDKIYDILHNHREFVTYRMYVLQKKMCEKKLKIKKKHSLLT